jgi:predicted nucleic acid-binding protein
VDLARCQELIAQYRDIDPGLADVAVVATAERMSVQRILTVDERDFRVMRPKKGMTFVLLPGDVEP